MVWPFLDWHYLLRPLVRYPATRLRGKAPSAEEADELRRQLAEFVAQQKDSEYLQALDHSTLADQIRNKQVTYDWGQGTVAYDRPEKILQDTDQTDTHLSTQMAHHFEGVNDELIIFSPYFVPGKKGTTFLVGLAERGVKVRILTNSLASNDVGIVHSGYAKYRKALLRGGVELYEMNKQLTRRQRKEKKGTAGSSKASLHAKSFVFDRHKVFIRLPELRSPGGGPQYRDRCSDRFGENRCGYGRGIRPNRSNVGFPAGIGEKCQWIRGHSLARHG